MLCPLSPQLAQNLQVRSVSRDTSAGASAIISNKIMAPEEPFVAVFIPPERLASASYRAGPFIPAHTSAEKRQCNWYHFSAGTVSSLRQRLVL